jgi:hypothetical protein
MKPKIHLSRDSKEVVAALKAFSDAASSRKMVRQAHWMITRAYLEGCRNFGQVDYTTGTVQTTYMNEQGQLGFRFEEVLSKFAAELGRYLQIDIRPLVFPKGKGVDALRGASVAQVALDYMNPEDELMRHFSAAARQFLAYGMIGIGTWIAHGVEDEDGTPLQPRMPRLELIPPWQLTPIPQDPASPSELLGIQRERWVPYQWLKTQSSPDGTPLVGKRSKKDLDVRAVPLGYMPSGASGMPDVGGSTSEANEAELGAGGGAGTTPEQEFVYLREAWLVDSMGDIGRYIVTAGDARLYDKDFTDETDPPPVPFGVACNSYGDFYGRAWIEPLISLNAESESMLQNLFENVQMFDLFGYVVIPNSLGIKRDQLQAGGKPKVLFSEINYTVPDQKVYNIGPSNSGTLPGKVAEMALALLHSPHSLRNAR